jgi:hypothetical protein
MDSCPGLVSNGSQSNINLTASTPTAQTTIQYAIISTAARHARTKRNRSLVWRESPVGRRRTLIMNGQNAYLCSDDYRWGVLRSGIHVQGTTVAFSYNAPMQTARLQATLDRSMPTPRRNRANPHVVEGAGEAKGQCGTAGGHLLIRSRHGAR